MLDAGRDGASAIATGDGEPASVSYVVMASAMRGANKTIRARQSMWGTMVRFVIRCYGGRLAGKTAQGKMTQGATHGLVGTMAAAGGSLWELVTGKLVSLRGRLVKLAARTQT